MINPSEDNRRKQTNQMCYTEKAPNQMCHCHVAILVCMRCRSCFGGRRSMHTSRTCPVRAPASHRFTGNIVIVIGELQAYSSA